MNLLLALAATALMLSTLKFRVKALVGPKEPRVDAVMRESTRIMLRGGSGIGNGWYKERRSWLLLLWFGCERHFGKRQTPPIQIACTQVL